MKELLEDLLNPWEFLEELSLHPLLAPENLDNPTYLGMKNPKTRRSMTPLLEEEDIHRTIQMTKEMEDLPEDPQEEEGQEEADQEEEDRPIITPSIDYLAEDNLMPEDRLEDDHLTSQNTILIQNSRSLTFQHGMAMSIPYSLGSKP